METIIFSPGHGGEDPGAVANGLKEIDLNLDIVNKIIPRMEKYICNPVIFQEPDKMDYVKAAKYANDVGASLFFSVHCNANPNPSANGGEILISKYSSERTVRIAEEVGKAFKICLDDNGLNYRGIKRRNDLYVLNETCMSAVMVECAFLTNSRDSDKLGNSSFRNILANELAWGIAQSLNLKRRETSVSPQEVEELRSKLSKLEASNREMFQVISTIETMVSRFILNKK